MVGKGKGGGVEEEIRVSEEEQKTEGKEGRNTEREWEKKNKDAMIDDMMIKKKKKKKKTEN